MLRRIVTNSSQNYAGTLGSHLARLAEQNVRKYVNTDCFNRVFECFIREC